MTWKGLKMINAKELYLSIHKEDAESVSQFVRTPFFKTALVHAYSFYATSGASSQELKGASEMIDILMSLGAPEKPTMFPTQSLKSDLGGNLV